MHSARGLRLAVAALIAAALMADTAAAYVEPTGPLSAFDISEDSPADYTPDAATNTRGDAYVIWHEKPDGPLRGRIVRVDGSRGPIETLSSRSEYFDDERAALNDAREGLVAWRRFDGNETALYARRRKPGGDWGDRIEVRAPGGYAFLWGIGIDEAGTATVVWQQAGGVYARRIEPSGEIGQRLEVAPDTSCCGSTATSAGGRTLIVWSRFTHTQVQVSGRAISPAGQLGDVVDLTADGDSARDPEVFAAPDGDAVVLWGRTDAEYVPGGDGRSWNADDSLGPVERIASESGNVSLRYPDLAFNSSGDAYVAWADGAGLYGRVRRSDGTLGEPAQLDPNGGRAEVGFDDGGNAVIAWTHAGIGIEARSRLADGRLSGAYSVSRNDDSLPIFAGISRDGRAVIVWPSSVLWQSATYIQGAYFDVFAPFGEERPRVQLPALPLPDIDPRVHPGVRALRTAARTGATRIARRLRAVGRSRMSARGRVDVRLDAPAAGTYTARIQGGRRVLGRARVRFARRASRRVAVRVTRSSMPRRVIVRVAFRAVTGGRAVAARRVSLR